MRKKYRNIYKKRRKKEKERRKDKMFSRMGSFLKSKFSGDKKPEDQQTPTKVQTPKKQIVPSTPKKQTVSSTPKKQQQTPAQPYDPDGECLIPIEPIEGINLFAEYPTHCSNFINDFGKGLELMMDYSSESSSMAIKKAERLNESLNKMETLTNGLEKYLNEMVMIAQTPKPNLSNDLTPYKRQRTLENMIISQINES